MRVLFHPATVASLLVAAVAGTLALQRPGDAASAFGDTSGAIYAAHVVGTTTLPPAPIVPVRTLTETTSLPPARASLTTTTARSVLSPAAGFNVQGGPTVSPSVINQVLAQYGSPMAGDGEQLYQLGIKYGIDPAYCLAFFVHESAAGTRGEAVLTHNLGNIRAVDGAPSLAGFRYYPTWLEGAEDWYRLVSQVYVQQWGLTTISSIIPVYAPSADNNDPQAYINDVEQMVATWRARS
ncbi:MAG TPA: glucosaminidase domain-containing protein [Chloroflexota bacterium]|nr:glucosaminidase domain-containing protein [Chloroflexota bacterium]